MNGRPTFAHRLAGLVAILVLAGCSNSSAGQLTRFGSPPYVRGSGTVATETRPLATFDALVAESGVSVTVVSDETGTTTATVTADDNLVSAVTTEVRDGTLFVGFGRSVESTLPLAVTVVTPLALTSVRAGAAAQVHLSGVDVPDLRVRAESSARVAGAGTVGRLELTVDAAATVEFGELTVTTARVELRTASTATLRVTGRVDGSCGHGSVLRLLGDPAAVDVTTDAGSSVVHDVGGNQDPERSVGPG